VAWVAQVYASLGGYRDARITWDRAALGPAGGLRLNAIAAWRQWTSDGYYGIGNHAPREAAFVGDFAADDPARRRYRYSLTQPIGQLTARLAVGGPWAVYGTAGARFSQTAAYPGSLFEEETPHGAAGGWALPGGAGVLFDTRQPEVDSRRGVLLELGARGNPPLPGGEGSWGGPLAGARGFFSLNDRVIFGGRVMAEWLFGVLPFYEMVQWGGYRPTMGFGGGYTLRGAPYGRWRAPGKAIANAELRLACLRHQLFGEPVDWQLVPFADAGAVWGGGEGDAGAAPPIHRGIGVGGHVVYAESFVGRVDVAWAPDTVMAEDGSLEQATNLGVYLLFDQMF